MEIKRTDIKQERRVRQAEGAAQRKKQQRERKPLDLSRPFMDSRQFAELLNVDKRSVERWRREGSGPPFCKLRGVVLYDTQAVLAWIRAHERTSTSAGG
jgi:transcriptional regulator with XRE-family HTH domain